MKRVPEAVCTFEIRPVCWNATPRVQEGLTATIVALRKAWVMTLKYLTLEAYLSKQWEPSLSRWQLFAPVSGVQPSILYIFCLHSGFAAFEKRSGRLWWKTHTISSECKENRRGFSFKKKNQTVWLMDVEADLKGCRVVWRGGGLSKHRCRLSVAASSRRDLTLPPPAAASLCVSKRCGSTRGFGPVFPCCGGPPPTSSFSYWGGGRRPWGPVWESPLKSVDRDTPLKIFGGYVVTF